jgi:hypoxanthine-guanine phosphoribosyltransferase
MVVDKEGKYIAHKQEAKAYIVLGNAKGICKFIKPLSNILKSLKPKINFSLISSLIENKMSSRNEEESE